MTLHVAVAGCCIKCAYSRSSLFQWFNLQFCRLGSTLPMQNLCFAGKILNWIQWSSLIEIGKSIGLKKTRNYSPPLESSISIWLINLAKKLTWGENRWFLDGKLPIFKKQGAQGGPAIVPMNSLNQFNNIQWRIHDLLGSFFQTHLKVKLGYGDMGLRAFPFHSLRALNEEMMEGEYCMQLELDNDVGWCLWSGRGLRLQYHVRL